MYHYQMMLMSLLLLYIKIIRRIGPTNNPITPIILKLVYIANNVNIGCIPILLLTSFGSINCLDTNIKRYNPNIENPKDELPFKNNIADQGIIMLPAPSIGNASTKPIKIAINIGYSISIPNK